jgi:hypothetical protein
MHVMGEQGRPIETIWWNCLDENKRTPQATSSIELAYTIETNVWNGEIRMQLNVEGMRTASP